VSEIKSQLINKLPIVRLLKFGTVGGSGVIVNSGILYLLTEFLSIDYRISSLAAIECAIINNFLWNYYWTFSERKSARKRGFFSMMLKFNLSSGFTAFVVNWGILFILTEHFHIYYQISNLIGIGLGTIVNFCFSHFWAFTPVNEKIYEIKQN
jgi:dolichol-phosphate mannosyltransferase